MWQMATELDNTGINGLLNLHLMLVGCVDPRGCQIPPLRTNTIWGSFEDSETQDLDVGSSYWYSCRTGLFELGNNNYSSYIDLVTI